MPKMSTLYKEKLESVICEGASEFSERPLQSLDKGKIESLIYMGVSELDKCPL